MTKKNYTKLSEDDLIRALDMLIDESDTEFGSDGRLSKERQTIQKYYDAEEPVATGRNNSKFISQDVFDSVESMSANLLETFAAGNDIGVFEPNGPNDVQHSKLSARYCDHVVFYQNDGFTLFQDVITDGLKGRIGVAKGYWDKCKEEYEETFENLPQEDVDALMHDPSVEITELEIEQDTYTPGAPPSFKGELKRTQDKSQCRLDAIAPEAFLLGPRSSKTERAFMGERIQMTRSDLRKRGIDEETIESIGDTDAKAWETDPEVLQRFQEAGPSESELNAFQEQVQQVWVVECYADMDVEGTGMTKLWRFLKAGKVILEQETVRRRPYLIFAPLRRSHAIVGSNFAQKVIFTQNAKTTLVRGVLDHTVRTNNPRHTILKGTLNNPDEMTDNRFGGLVNVNRPDGIHALEQPPLNPFVFQTVQTLDYALEGSTGQSKLSQGLNKDAISKQNSQALVETLMNAGQIRTKIIARGFAVRFLKQLYELVYEIVMENEDRACMLEIAGDWVEVNPSRWTRHKPFRVQLALGYGEKDRQANDWAMYGKMMGEDPGMGPLYTVQERYNVVSRYLEAKGEKNPSAYVKPPQQVQKPQPDPIKMGELQVMQTKAETERMKTEIELTKLKLQHQTELDKHATQIAKLQSQHALATDQQDLAEREFAHRVEVDTAEIALQHSAQQQTAIVAPKG